MIRAVLDTNCVVSALLKPLGNERRVLRLALARQFQLLASVVILEEYQAVLKRPKLRLSTGEVRDAMSGIHQVAAVIEPEPGPRSARWRTPGPPTASRPGAGSGRPT